MPRYIDADALNAAIEEWFDGACVYDVSPSEAVYDFQSIVDEQPTISPDEVRGVGKWSEGGYFDEMYGRSCVCSACGRDALGFTNYCPNCGAKMEVSEDA